MKHDSAALLLVVDLAGTFVFAVEGATSAIEGNLDLLGLMVLAFATALAGGIIRDLLIGATPPGAIRDWRYAAVAFLAAVVVFVWHRFVSQVPYSVIVVVDAAGLGLFAVSGAAKALDYGIHPFLAILMGGSRVSAAGQCAMCYWRGSQPCCAPMFTPPQRWRARP